MAKTIDSYLLKETLKTASVLARIRPGWRLLAGSTTVYIARYIRNVPVYAIKCFESARPLTNLKVTEGATVVLEAQSAEGSLQVRGTFWSAELARCEVWLQPHRGLRLDGESEDLHLVDTKGETIFAQRKAGSGFVFGRVGNGSGSHFLYLQNFTSLNRFFEDTNTRPTGTVFGHYPQVGFRRPTCDKPLQARKNYQILDTFVATIEHTSKDGLDDAEAFLRLLDSIYLQLPKPETEFFDWREQSEKTAAALERSTKCSILIEGKKYLLPYVRGGRPDSLSQLHTLAWISQYDLVKDRSSKLREELSETVSTFLNEEDGRIERFPCFGDNDCGQTEKLDSWYSIFSLLNLADIAKSGDVGAFQCFKHSLDFIIKAANRFDYDFPVFFDSKTLRVIQQSRGEISDGQTDVAGLYAWVMLHAYDLTQDIKHLHEAKTSLLRTATKSFDLCYQTNVTAWGAAAAFRCWKDSGDDRFYKIGVLYLANFFRYCNFFETEYGHGADYQCFFSVMALSSSEYPAMLENSDSCAAISDIVRRCDRELPDWLSRLCNEYCKYALVHCRYYFPDQLPAKVLSKKPREGEIDRELPIALEDLYVNSEKEPGSVGQEIYGSCGAFALALLSTAHIAEIDAVVHCEYPFKVVGGEDGVELQLTGRPEHKCRITVTSKSLSGLTLIDDTDRLALGKRGGRSEHVVSGGATVVLTRNA